MATAAHSNHQRSVHSNGTPHISNIDSLRGPKETSWSWETRKKFILYHMAHSDLTLDMINCYAWTLVNSRTLGCRYDQVHIAALNLLAVEADIEQDLEMGGPTPQIVSNSASNSRRGRGGGRGGASGGGSAVNGEGRKPFENGTTNSRQMSQTVPVLSMPLTPAPLENQRFGSIRPHQEHRKPDTEIEKAGPNFIPRSVKILPRPQQPAVPLTVAGLLPLIPPIHPLPAFLSAESSAIPPLRIEPALLLNLNVKTVEEIEAEQAAEMTERLNTMSLIDVGQSCYKNVGQTEVPRLNTVSAVSSRLGLSGTPTAFSQSMTQVLEHGGHTLDSSLGICSITNPAGDVADSASGLKLNKVSVGTLAYMTGKNNNLEPPRPSRQCEQPNILGTRGQKTSKVRGMKSTNAKSKTASLTLSADAIAFLRKRPRNEITLRLCGDLIEKHASRILYETIDVNKSTKLIQVESSATTHRPGTNDPQVQSVTVRYAGFPLITAQGISLKDVKNHVSFLCLKALMEHFSTVKISASDATFTQSISHPDFISGAVIDQILCQVTNPVSSKPHSSSNFGYRLMRRYGWKEGRGLGSTESGVLYAISTSAAQVGYNSGFSRPGLGWRDSSDQALIADRCDELCQIFLANAVLLEDMVFSSDFSLQEREVLHSVAEKYGLSHNSSGSGENRHIVLRYKWALPKLVEELRRIGGKTGRYELVEPSSI